MSLALTRPSRAHVTAFCLRAHVPRRAGLLPIRPAQPGGEEAREGLGRGREFARGNSKEAALGAGLGVRLLDGEPHLPAEGAVCSDSNWGSRPSRGPRLGRGPARVPATGPGWGASPRPGPPPPSPPHAPAPQAWPPAHLHQHRLAELLPVDDFDGHLLAGDTVNPQLHEACGRKAGHTPSWATPRASRTSSMALPRAPLGVALASAQGPDQQGPACPCSQLPVCLRPGSHGYCLPARGPGHCSRQLRV